MAAECELNQLLLRAILEFNAQAGQGRHLGTRPEERLFGEDGLLDSLGLVNLITLIEEHIEDAYDISVRLADEKALSRKSSPFLTVGSLSDFIGELLAEHPDA